MPLRTVARCALVAAVVGFSAVGIARLSGVDGTSAGAKSTPGATAAKAPNRSTAAPAGPLTRPIRFPVLGPVEYIDDYGDCRDACARFHLGTDLIGEKMQPLVAAVDAKVTKIFNDTGNHGIGVQLTDAEGWSYEYLHVNNDVPGDMTLSTAEAETATLARWHMPLAITVGAQVTAGQVIGWMGNSGNAEHSVPHLHFEIIGPDNHDVNPFPSLVLAQWHDRCRNGAKLDVHQPPVLSPPPVVAGTIHHFATLTGAGAFTISASGGVLLEGDAVSIGAATAKTPPCDGRGPVLVSKALPPGAPDGPGASESASTVLASPVPPVTVDRSSLPADVERPGGDSG